MLFLLTTTSYETMKKQNKKSKTNTYTCFFLENTKFNYFTTANYIYRSSLVFLSINHPYRFPFICFFLFIHTLFPNLFYTFRPFIIPQFFFNPNILKNEKILTKNLLITLLGSSVVEIFN